MFVLRDNPRPYSADVTKVTFAAAVGCEIVNPVSDSPYLTQWSSFAKTTQGAPRRRDVEPMMN
jgi:hypothetical protein